MINDIDLQAFQSQHSKYIVYMMNIWLGKAQWYAQ